ncbi:MAG: YkgJ family cysteine cluster protein [Myxococcota bacterium]|nr:YkgJ family cysteine cluster protein [Myxococcota bacterium]
MTEFIPALRAGLHVEEDAITDPDLGRRLRLDERFLAVARALPGSVATVAEHAGVDAELVPRIAALLDTHHLLDTPTARTHAEEAARTEAIRTHDPDTVPLLIRDDAAFTCTMCGSCCGGHNIGPVLADTLDGLAPHMPRLATAARLDQSPFYTLPGDPHDDPSALCRTQDGSCVFLDDDRKCLIHAMVGGEKKPRVCQLFPWEFKATPAGVAVTISNECRGFAEARGGQRLSEREADIRRLLRLVPGGRIEAVPALATLAPGAPVSFARWSTVTDTMHAALDAHTGDPMRAFVAMTEAVGASDIRGDDDALFADLASLCAAIKAALCALVQASEPPTDELLVRNDGLALVTEALETLPRDLRRTLAPLERVEHGALFSALMHHRLASHALLEAKSVAHGLAWSVFGWLVGRASSVHRARQVKRRHTTTQDLVDAVAPITFVLRAGRVRAALRPFDEAVVDLFFHRLEALRVLGPAQAEAGLRLELHAS